MQGELKRRAREDYRKIRASILKHGIVVPLFIWRDGGRNRVIDGTGRTETLRKMAGEGFAIPPLPVVFIHAKDEAEAKEILLKISSHYGQVSQKGFEEFIRGLEIDFEDLGLDVKPPRDVGEELGLVPATKAEPATRPGDVYEIGSHRLICGDSAEPETYRLLMGDELADLVFTDPPYGVKIGEKNQALEKHGKNSTRRVLENIENDTLDAEALCILLTQVFKNVRERMKDEASYYVTGPQGQNAMMMTLSLLDAGIPAKHQLVWCKSQPTFSMGRLDYDYQHEPIFYGWKRRHNFYGMGKYRTSLWHYDKPKKSGLHPTMKPPALIENAILNSMEPLEKSENALLNSSVKNDIILDPFAGSGSTLIAAEDCKRRSRLIEIDPHYCDVTVKRALEAYPKLKARVTHENEDGTPEEVTAETFSDGN
ncbi:MAG: DNA modification methylase [Spirochaetaceae bacterium]|nr:DNA modification methylase [Spirochaetaceae bacterium]